MDLDTPTVNSSANQGKPESITSIVEGMKPIAKERSQALEAQIGDIEKTASRDVGRAEKAYKNTGIDPGDFKPWDAEAESEKRRTDPVMAFGSLGSIFGILASAFTHAPMANAMNASAAAINAVRAGDAEDYERAAKAWHDNTQLALQRHKIQQEAYQDALELMKTNMALGTQRMGLLAARFDDKQMSYLLDHGMNKEVFDLAEKRNDIATKMQEDKLKWTFDNAKMHDLIDDPRFKLPPGDPRRAQLIQEWNNRWGPLNRAGANDPIKERQRQILDSDLPWDEQVKQLTELAQSVRGGPTVAQQAGKAVEEKVTGAPEGTSRMEAVKEAQTKSGGGGSGLSAADAAEVRRRTQENIDAKMTPREAYDEARKSVAADTKNIGASPSLSDESLNLMADQYIAGDKSVFQNLGRQAQGAANIVALRDRVTKKVLDQGVTGPELATRMAEFSGMLAAQRTLGVRTANVELFNNEALKMMDVAETQSHKFERTNFPAINRALQAWESNTGDPGIRSFGASINSLVNAYAKAIQGGGQATVSDKEHAREILSTADTSEQFDAVISVLKAELQAARQAPGAVKQELRDLSSGGSTIDKGKVPQPKGVIRYDNQGNRINE